jgi:hypothetical protein
VLLLTREHRSITWQDFAQLWQDGKAGVLSERAGVLYCSARHGPRDFLEVPSNAPKFDCCGCGCVDMWGKPHNGKRAPSMCPAQPAASQPAAH